MLTVYDIHCVDERLSNIYNCYVRAHDLWEPASPHVYDYPTNCW